MDPAFEDVGAAATTMGMAASDPFAGWIDDSDEDGDVCRVCRLGAFENQPLIAPCRCSGSIRHVHEECLLRWIRHQRGDSRQDNHVAQVGDPEDDNLEAAPGLQVPDQISDVQGAICELCRTPFRFENVYAPNAPRTLSVREVFIELIRSVLCKRGLPFLSRIALLAMVWMFVVPFCTFRALSWSLSFPPTLFSRLPETASAFPVFNAIVSSMWSPEPPSFFGRPAKPLRSGVIAFVEMLRELLQFNAKEFMYFIWQAQVGIITCMVIVIVTITLNSVFELLAMLAEGADAEAAVAEDVDIQQQGVGDLNQAPRRVNHDYNLLLGGRPVHRVAPLDMAVANQPVNGENNDLLDAAELQQPDHDGVIEDIPDLSLMEWIGFEGSLGTFALHVTTIVFFNVVALIGSVGLPLFVGQLLTRGIFHMDSFTLAAKFMQHMMDYLSNLFGRSTFRSQSPACRMNPPVSVPLWHCSWLAEHIQSTCPSSINSAHASLLAAVVEIFIGYAIIYLFLNQYLLIRDWWDTLNSRRFREANAADWVNSLLLRAMLCFKIVSLLIIELTVCPVYFGLIVRLALRDLIPSWFAASSSSWGWNIFYPGGPTMIFRVYIAGLTFMVAMTGLASLLRGTLRRAVLASILRYPDELPDMESFKELVEVSFLTHMWRLFVSSLVYTFLILIWVHVPVRAAVRFFPSIKPLVLDSSLSSKGNFIILAVCAVVMQLMFSLVLRRPGSVKTFAKRVFRTWLRVIARPFRLDDYLLAPEVVNQHGIDEADVVTGNREHFSLRMFCVLLALWTSEILMVQLVFVFPLMLGRVGFNFIRPSIAAMTLSRSANPLSRGSRVLLLFRNDGFAFFFGLLSISVVIVIVQIIGQAWGRSDGARNLALQFRERGMILLKLAVACSLVVGVLPIMLGVVVETVVFLPVRVAPHETYAFTDFAELWVKGVTVAYLWTYLQLHGYFGEQSMWKQKLERIERDGVFHFNLAALFQDLVVPIGVELGMQLCLPYAFARGLIPILPIGLSPVELSVIFHYSFIGFASIRILMRIAWALFAWYIRLQQHFYESKYLVRTRLQNFEI